MIKLSEEIAAGIPAGFFFAEKFLKNFFGEVFLSSLKKKK